MRQREKLKTIIYLPIQQDPETGAIVLCAIRYCLGRRTYMPELVINWCKRHWVEIPARDRQLIERDIKTEIDRENQGLTSLGDTCDSKAWREFTHWIKLNSTCDKQKSSSSDCQG